MCTPSAIYARGTLPRKHRATGGDVSAYGLTVPLSGLPLSEQRDVIASLPGLGYTDVWSAEAGGTDAFTPLALASAWAPPLRLGTAIVPAFTRGAPTIAQSAAALADA